MEKVLHLVIVEGIFYENPAYEMLLANHPVMVKVWQTCFSLSKKKGYIMAPLLNDDRPQEDGLVWQTFEGFLQETIGRRVSDFRWMGNSISEGRMEEAYGKIGCEGLYTQYHLEIFSRLTILGIDWSWIKVQPKHFQKMNNEALLQLWKEFRKTITPNAVAGTFQGVKPEDFITQIRENFFSHFRFRWVDADGEMSTLTQAIFIPGKNPSIRYEEV